MSRISEIYEFTKNKDKTRSILMDFIVEKFNLKYGYASSFLTQHVQSGVLASKNGYIFVSNEVITGLANVK